MKGGKLVKGNDGLMMNQALSTLWVDTFSSTMRNDNICLLSAYTELPGGKIEQSRIMASKEAIKKLIHILCTSTGYWPKNIIPAKQVKKAKKKQQRSS